jgi:hypothetical protein
MSAKFCAQCGAGIGPADKFCALCGTKIVSQCPTCGQSWDGVKNSNPEPKVENPPPAPTKPVVEKKVEVQIEKPVFIIGSYRGGTSLLFRLLSESKELWSMYRESNHIWQSYHRDLKESSDTVYFEELENGNFLNTNINEEIKDLEEKKILMDLAYHYSTYNSYILGYLGRVKLLREGFSWILDLINFFNYMYKAMNIVTYRIVDKTPPNIFRVDFLAKLYPDAKFIYLTRDGKDNINSLISAWCHKSKFKYPYRKYLGGNLELKDCDSKVWKFFIPKDFKAFAPIPCL